MDESDIRQTLEINGLKIIRRYPSDEDIDSYLQVQLNRNIEAYDGTGKLIWMIEECPVGGDGVDKAYMNIWIENDKLIAGNWIGLNFIVNLENGTVKPANPGSRLW